MIGCKRRDVRDLIIHYLPIVLNACLLQSPRTFTTGEELACLDIGPVTYEKPHDYPPS